MSKANEENEATKIEFKVMLEKERTNDVVPKALENSANYQKTSFVHIHFQQAHLQTVESLPHIMESPLQTVEEKIVSTSYRTMHTICSEK